MEGHIEKFIAKKRAMLIGLGDKRMATKLYLAPLQTSFEDKVNERTKACLGCEHQQPDAPFDHSP